MNVAICTIYSLVFEYFKVEMKNSGDFSNHHQKITMQFDWFLSVLEQKRLENHDIYYIGATELPFRFPRCAPLLGWRYL